MDEYDPSVKIGFRKIEAQLVTANRIAYLDKFGAALESNERIKINRAIRASIGLQVDDPTEG